MQESGHAVWPEHSQADRSAWRRVVVVQHAYSRSKEVWRARISTVVVTAMLWKIATGSSSQDASIRLPGISHADMSMSFGRFSRSRIYVVSRTNSQILSACDSAISPSRRDKLAQSLEYRKPSMETSSIEYAAYVGLDWADREHAWCLHVPGIHLWTRASFPRLRKQ